MKRSPGPPDAKIYPVLKRYSEGKVSAYDAACEIQALNLPGYNDPSASEVVLWAKMTGYGIPTPSEEEAEEEARRILESLSTRGAGDPGGQPD